MKPVALSAFLGHVKGVLQDNFSKGVWVTAEILSISGTGHRYLELVEYDNDRREIAKAKGVIWKSAAGMLDAFKKVTGNALQADMKVLARVSPRFHESFGFSLVIEELNPTYTLGDMEIRLKAIRDFLREKGVIESNKRLRPPEDFFRLAVIAPAEAAGLGDFRTEADHIASLGLCEFAYFHASFQGETAGDQIVDAMALVVAAHKARNFDALIILRGGGDKAGLYQLNHKRLCHAVCRVPLPVMIGIGHERDKLLLDELANLRFPTPSLVISHIKQTMIANANAAHDAFEALDRAAESVLVGAEEHSQRLLDQLAQNAAQVLERAEQGQTKLYENLLNKAEQRTGEAEQVATRTLEKIVNHADRLADQAEESSARLLDQVFTLSDKLLDQAESQAKHLITQVMASNPLAILAQGYGYVNSSAGHFVTRMDQAQPGQTLTITLQDGSFGAVVAPQKEAS